MSDIKIEDNFLSSIHLRRLQELFYPQISPILSDVKKKFGDISWRFGLVDHPSLYSQSTSNIPISEKTISYHNIDRVQNSIKKSGEDLPTYKLTDPKYTYQLSCMIYHTTSLLTGIDPIVSSSAHFIIPLFFSSGKIKSPSIIRIKSNLQLKTTEIETSPFHIDYRSEDNGNEYDRLKTSIFYINSNDGYTEFKDGTKIESVANRLITFPSYMEHRGTSCTDKPFRLVINFNYF